MEFGTFLGYTAVLLGTWMKEPCAPRHCVSFEVDFVHALLTRHMLSVAHLVMLDVWVGQANDLIPRTAEDLDESSVCFAFMDHR